jgi:hypothetical protein
MRGIIINDPYLGEREVGDKAALIADQLRLLNVFKNDGRIPSQHLLDDIRVYEFILKSQDPDVYAENYLTKIEFFRTERQTLSVSKMEVAMALGWDIE